MSQVSYSNVLKLRDESIKHMILMESIHNWLTEVCENKSQMSEKTFNQLRNFFVSLTNLTEEQSDLLMPLFENYRTKHDVLGMQSFEFFDKFFPSMSLRV